MTHFCKACYTVAVLLQSQEDVTSGSSSYWQRCSVVPLFSEEIKQIFIVDSFKCMTKIWSFNTKTLLHMPHLSHPPVFCLHLVLSSTLHLSLPLCLSFSHFPSSSLPVPSVHCHIEFSQEFEHELIISNSCCSCVRVLVCVCVYVSEFVCVWWMLTILTGSLSPQSQFHTPSILPNSTHTGTHIVHMQT